MIFDVDVINLIVHTSIPGLYKPSIISMAYRFRPTFSTTQSRIIRNLFNIWCFLVCIQIIVMELKVSKAWICFQPLCSLLNICCLWIVYDCDSDQSGSRCACICMVSFFLLTSALIICNSENVVNQQNSQDSWPKNKNKVYEYEETFLKIKLKIYIA